MIEARNNDDVNDAAQPPVNILTSGSGLAEPDSQAAHVRCRRPACPRPWCQASTCPRRPAAANVVFDPRPCLCPVNEAQPDAELPLT